VSADMQTIMTSLNLHMILSKSSMQSRYDRPRDSLCDNGGRERDTSSSRQSERHGQRQRQRNPRAQTFTGVAPFRSMSFHSIP
jgi:hypothetical protein